MEAQAAARRGRSLALGGGGGGGTGGAGRARGAARERSAPGAAAAPGSRPRQQPAERSGGRGGDGSPGCAGRTGGGGRSPEPGAARRSPEQRRARGARAAGAAGQGALRSARAERPPGRAPRTRVGSRLSPAALAPAPRRHRSSRRRAQATKAEDAAVGQGQDLALKPGGGALAFPRTEELSPAAGACSRGRSRAPRRWVSRLRGAPGPGAPSPRSPSSCASPPGAEVLAEGVGGWWRRPLRGPASRGRTATAPGPLSGGGSAWKGAPGQRLPWSGCQAAPPRAPPPCHPSPPGQGYIGQHQQACSPPPSRTYPRRL